MLVDWGAHGALPAHIWCFVDLTSFESVTQTVEFGGIDLKSGVHAVVECSMYLEDEELVAQSDIFIPLELEVDGFGFDQQTGKSFTRRRFFLADC